MMSPSTESAPVSGPSVTVPSTFKLPSITGPPPGWKPKPKPKATAQAKSDDSLPPGMILDENGKPCKICNSWQVWSKAGAKGEGEAGRGSGVVAKAAAGGTAGIIASGSTSDISTSTTETEPVEPARPSHCPPDVNALGRSTWTFLHTTAAYYPISAPPATQQSMLSLLSSLSLLYPCTYCATDFREKIKENRPDVSGREGLSRWLCERHNEVNERLGKGGFDCGEKSLRERWRDGPADGSCD